MSPNSVSNARLKAAAALLLTLVAHAASARPLPALPFEPVLVGEGTLRMYGFRIYDSRLYAPQQSWRADAPFALELAYAREFKGADIARRSIDEIRAQRPLDDATARRWQTELARIFPDVREGDRLTGLRLPGQGARFFDGAKLIGELRDETLADAFFDIWLAPDTRAPKLRRQLLGAP